MSAMNGRLLVASSLLLLSKGVVVANPLPDEGGKLSERTASEPVTRDTECSEPLCDMEGGRCVEGECVCNKGRTGPGCSKAKDTDFPSDPAAKLDVVLSLVTAIILLGLVLCALLPITAIRLRCGRRKAKEEYQLGDESVDVIKNSRAII